MLAECMIFHDEKMPDPNTILKPKESKANKAQPRYSKQKQKKLSIANIEGLEQLKQLEEETLKLLKEQEETTLAEKVLKRKQEEQENRKKEVLKKLNKPKNIDINKFLTRSVVYEQKKNFDLEQKRFKKLEEEAKYCQDRPLLSPKTEEIYKSLDKKNLNTREIKEKNINDRKKWKSNYNTLLRGKNNKFKNENNSMDKIKSNKNKSYEKKKVKKDYIINEKIKNKKMNKNEMDEYYKRQNDWKNQVEKKNINKERNRNKRKKVEIEDYFHPQISEGTKEIINEKNKEHNNENNNNHYYYIKKEPNKLLTNLGKNAFDRLYEDNILYEIKKNENKNKAEYSFQPFINKNKYKQIQPKYNQINIINEKRKERKKKRYNKLKGKSVEYNNKDDIFNNNKKILGSSVDNANKYSEENINEPWINTLFKLKNSKKKDKDKSYRLNIRQGSAWNENDINPVPYTTRTLEIIKYFI